MFKQAFQGGPFIPLLEVKGQAPAQGWNTKKASVTRSYNKEMKTYVLEIGGQVGSKITMPEAPERQFLGITQQFFVLQLFIPKDQIFSLNLGVVDHMKNRIRLYFSTANKTVKITSLHARIPLHAVAGTWSCIVFDLMEITRACFPASEFASLSSIELMPSCTILRVFTTKACPLPTLELYCPKDEEDARANPRMPKPKFSLRQHVPLDKKVEIGLNVHIQILDEFYLTLFRENKPNTDLAVRDQSILLEVRREFIPGYKECAEVLVEAPKPVRQAQSHQGVSNAVRGTGAGISSTGSPTEDIPPPERTYNVIQGNSRHAPGSNRETDNNAQQKTRKLARPQGTNSIKAALEHNADKPVSSTTAMAPSQTTHNSTLDERRQRNKIPQPGITADFDASGIDLTLNAIPVILKPEQCGKSVTSANGVTTDRCTTPVLRNKGVRIGLVDDEPLGSTTETANYAVMGDAFIPDNHTDHCGSDLKQSTKSVVDSLIVSNEYISQSVVDSVYNSAVNERDPTPDDVKDCDYCIDDLGGHIVEAEEKGGQGSVTSDDQYSYYSDDSPGDDDIPDPAIEDQRSAIPEPASNLRIASALAGGMRYDANTGAYLEIDDADIPGPIED